MTDLLPFAAPILAIAAGIYATWATVRNQREQGKTTQAAQTVQLRAQEWTELKETVAYQGGEIRSLRDRLKDCYASEETLRDEIAELRAVFRRRHPEERDL